MLSIKITQGVEMEKIEIPDEFADLIESAEKVRSGQLRKYAPFDEVYGIKLKNDYDDKDEVRILDFCQKYCHKCKYTEQQLLEIKRSRDRSFDELMMAIAEGSYTMRHDFADKKEVVYKWSQDYLD